MNMTRTSSVALASTFLLLGACASPKQVKLWQDELRALKEERTALKKELRDLRSQNDSFETSLAEASIKPSTPATVQDNPALDDLGIEYGNRGGNYVISIPAEVTFPQGKAELTKRGKEALQTVARVLLDQHRDGNFWIEGHTDTDPIKKSGWESNRDLSVERAMAVLHYLVEDCNVPDEQCVVAGHGQYQPISANADNAGKARNRRVEIVVRKR
jgi:chemotaxis protein MotB